MSAARFQRLWQSDPPKWQEIDRILYIAYTTIRARSRDEYIFWCFSLWLREEKQIDVGRQKVLSATIGIDSFSHKFAMATSSLVWFGQPIGVLIPLHPTLKHETGLAKPRETPSLTILDDCLDQKLQIMKID